MEVIKELKTGDILLTINKPTSVLMSIYDSLIRWFTKSQYTHTAIVLRDPTWIKPDLKGIYVYESSIEKQPDPEDHENKFGVQLTPIREFFDIDNQEIYKRELIKGSELITEEKLKLLHSNTYNKLYDFFPKDLLDAAWKKNWNYKSTDRFFCSALVCYALHLFNMIPEDTNWSDCAPGDLSSSETSKSSAFIKFLPNCKYGPDLRIC